MKYRIFNPDYEAEFLNRPNRFVIEARVAGQAVLAHCPNPGRMRELLIPGRKVILEKSKSTGRKTQWTLAAVNYNDRIVPLISSRSNNAAGNLIIPSLYPGFEAVPEQKLGASRIDWLLKGESENLWIEVKSCTLVEHHRAMFPDAPSERAVKHLNELMTLGGRGRVLFTVMNDSARVFSANPHTDPQFAKALKMAHSAGVGIQAVTMNCSQDGWLSVSEMDLPVDLSAAAIAELDSGVVFKTWTENDSTWRLSMELKEENITRSAASRQLPDMIPAEALRDSALLIRGENRVFDSIESELENIFGTGVFSKTFSYDPFRNPEFLSLVLDYRHRRVF